MHRLFLKIFLWFWATVILVGIALVLSFVFSPKGSYLPWQSVGGISRDVAAELNRHGTAGAATLLSRLKSSRGLKTCLYDQNGTPVAGDDCASFQAMASRAAAEPVGPGTDAHSGVYRNLLRLHDAKGQNYFLGTELPFGPGPAHHTLFGFIIHWLVMLLVSSGICYFLTLRLTNPILRLRVASRQIADGNLHARVASGVEKRGDEFGDLARDFNLMAERIESLLSSQRQLISDVSHELRSPLTRIQLALDLMRKRVGDDPNVGRIHTDLNRLEEIIGRLLTMARLEAGAAAIKWEKIELSGLIAEIASDAQLEARERNCNVAFSETGEFTVMGDESLLRSALENIVRNAVYYTNAGTEIQIVLTRQADAEQGTVLLEVNDHGPGVPEGELENIFMPFYRVDYARDRQSGGTGLGLAIASRVIQLHRGKISAGNRPGGGLRVAVALPLA